MSGDYADFGNTEPAPPAPPTPPAPPAPETEAEPEPEGGEEQREGLSARHQKVATLLTQLATTARSFLLYDARNAAIHKFLQGLLDAFRATLAEEGQVVVAIQPFEVSFEGQVVYLNRDRERSLAFRLYRDGVRGLTFQQGFDWEELARLLEVLSVRYTGVHQHEDDMVTLLWKASFAHLDVQAVEGFVPEADAEVPPGGTAAAAADGTAFPLDLDLARPHLPATAPTAWVVIPEARLEALRAEASAAALPADCLLLVERLRRHMADASDPLPLAELHHLLTEIRDFLLADEHVAPLAHFLRILKAMAEEEPPAWDRGRGLALKELAASCGDYRAVQRLLHSVPVDEKTLRPELVEVLDLACPDPLGVVAAVLAAERGMAARVIARQILEHYGAAHLDALQERFRQAPGPVASDLLRVIAHVSGPAAAGAVAQQCCHAEREVQEEALWHLERMPYSGVIGRALAEAFRRAELMRPRILALMAKSGDRRFVDQLARHVEQLADSITPEEAEEIGRIMGRLAGAPSRERWQAYLKPSGLLKKTLHGPLALHVAAAAALSEIPGEESANALRSALLAASTEAQPWLKRSFTHQRGPLKPGTAGP